MSTFLIADDYDVKRTMLKIVVQQSKIATTLLEASNTDDAKALIDANDVDFAFIDYEMPRELGPAVIKHLREKNPNAKIALVTSANSQHYKDDAMEAGADAFVCSSFQADKVHAKLMDLLEEWKHS